MTGCPARLITMLSAALCLLCAVAFPVFLCAQEEDPSRGVSHDAAQAFLAEALPKYELPFKNGLESFTCEMTVVTTGANGGGGGGRGGRGGAGRRSASTSFTYAWQAPNDVKVTSRNIPRQFTRLIQDPIIGIWKDLVGAAVFPDLEGGNLAIEGLDEGVAITWAVDEETEICVLFDPETKIVLQEEVTLKDRTAEIVPAYAVVNGLLRLEGKRVITGGGADEELEADYEYGGFRHVGDFDLPSMLTVNLGANEVVFNIEYQKINGKIPETAEMDPAVVKQMVKEFEKKYSKMSKPEKLDGMKELAATGHNLAAKSIIKKGLKDKDLSVREEAANHLGHMGCRSVVKTIANELKKNDKNIKVYAALIAALGNIGDPKAVPYLASDLWNQKEPTLRRQMARAKIDALGDIRSKKSVEALIDLMYKGGQGAMRSLMGPISQSLQRLTGQDFGSDRDGWKTWWKKNKSKFKLEEDR